MTLEIVPDPAPECRCDRESGRYWFQGEWRCKATKAVVRSYRGWKHYAGHQKLNFPQAEDTAA